MFHPNSSGKLICKLTLDSAFFGAAFFPFPKEKVMVGEEKAAAEPAKARREAEASFILILLCEIMLDPEAHFYRT